MEGSWRRLLYRKSRSRAFLWKMALGLIALGVLAGWVLDLLDFGHKGALGNRLAAELLSAGQYDMGFGQSNSRRALALLEQAALDRDNGFQDFLDATPFIAGVLSADQADQYENILSQRFGYESAALLADYFLALGEKSESAAGRLSEKAEREPPVRWANQILGEIEASRKNLAEAYQLFKKEGLFPDAGYARQRAVQVLLAREDYDELFRLREEPLYEEAFAPGVELELAIHSRDWLALFLAIPAIQFAFGSWEIYLIAGMVALVWAALLLHFGQIDKANVRLGVLCFAGFVLGVLSVTPTLFLVILQDDILEWSPSGDWMRVFAYYIGGVGLREELCKLLLFLPLAPFLAKRGDRLEMLIVASFVGLGFAAEENVNYFQSSDGRSVAGRFLTANFLHITLTGVAGLNLCLIWKRGWHGLNEFLYVFGIVVILHGAYDAFLSIQEIQEGDFIAIALFILLSKYYFSELHAYRYATQSMLSLTSIFVFGISLLVAAMIAYQSSQIGLSLSLRVLIPELLGSAILLFMFFREFDEAIGP